ncbi:hypothetical protein HPB50_019680 [Hyalomma asiaticum]|uniref:Uncharacterized protein n=1 Tax=Hyalomma asiaticum TaxID=266040 RepID=A0ACB7TL53_HYAAI|nr:hypothetical protein HPB50_019680 [Hyalomma asiaticum]
MVALSAVPDPPASALRVSGHWFQRRTQTLNQRGHILEHRRTAVLAYRPKCPQTTPKPTAAEGEKIRSLPEKLIARAACEPTAECVIPATERASRSRLTWVELVSAGRKFKACLDSGSEITVLREGLIPTEAKLKGVGKVRLRGPFGHAVPADLVYVPLGLHSPEGGATSEVVELCAVTDKLGKGVDSLLAPCTLEKLMQIQKESVEFAVRMARAEQVIAEVDCECEMSADEVSVDRPDSTDSREGSLTQSHASGNEAGNRMFEKQQGEVSSLRTACDQAREGTQGMFREGGLLYHRELLSERQCREAVVRETRRGEVLAPAHGAPRDERFSRNEGNERVRNAVLANDIGHWKAPSVLP